MPDYRYDVFVSHKRGLIFNEWLKDYFLPLFSDYLREDVRRFCQRPMMEIFYDEKTIEPGNDWKNDLRVAIRESRCMLSLCSPEYFYSDWCLTEWRSFRRRAELKSARVLIPISVHDGEGFPDDAKALQTADLSAYVIVGPGFRKSEIYTDFQVRLKALSEAVARKICAAPAYEAWPVVENVEVAGGPAQQTPSPVAPPQQLSTFE